jgi:hypothetical protein
MSILVSLLYLRMEHLLEQFIFLIYFIDFLNLKALQCDTLLGYYDLIILTNVRITKCIPKHHWISSRFESLRLLVSANIPHNNFIVLWRMINDNSYCKWETSWMYFFDIEVILLSGIGNFKAKLIVTLPNIIKFDISDFLIWEE